MSSTTRPPIHHPTNYPSQQQQQLPDSGLLSHYANYLNEQFLNRPATSGDYVWGNQQNINPLRIPPSTGLYPDPLYPSRPIVPTFPQTQQQQQQSWLHRTVPTRFYFFRTEIYIEHKLTCNFSTVPPILIHIAHCLHRRLILSITHYHPKIPKATPTVEADIRILAHP